MAYLPAIVAVSFYFEKRRSLATGIAVCGSGVGTFIFAPLTEILLNEYGWKGTVLIEAAILLNCMLCGAVFRPLPVVTSSGKQHADGVEQGSETLGKLKFVVDREVNESEKSANKPLTSSSWSLMVRKQELNGMNANKKLFCSDTQLAKKRFADKRYNKITDNDTSLGPMARKDIFYTASLRNIPLFDTDEAEYRRSMVNVNTDTDSGKGGCRLLQMLGCSNKTLKEMMDCHLMIDVIFQLFAISNLLTSIGLCVPYVFLPDRATSLGLQKNEGAFLISIVGISNTVGRIVFGFLADFKFINRLMLYNTVLVLCGVCSLLSALCFNYPLMCVYAASFGLFIGMPFSKFFNILRELFLYECMLSNFILAIMLR